MKYKKIIAVVLSILLLHASFTDSICAYDANFQSFINGFKNSENQEGTSYVIYSDERNELAIFCKDGKLQRYLNGDIKILEDYFEGSKLLHIQFDDLNRSVQTSNDKYTIIFYGKNGKSYSYDRKIDLLKILPMEYAKIIWDENGNDIAFISNQDPAWSGMGQINIIPKGLFIVDNNGGYKKIVDSSLYVNFKSRKKDGTHFVLASVYDPASMILKNINEVVYVDGEDNLAYCEYIPDGLKSAKYFNIKSYNSIISQFPYNCSIFFSGKYVLTNYNDGYARYDLNLHTKKTIHKPIGVYKGCYYYYSTPGTGKIKKINIATLSNEQTIRAYAGGPTAYINGNCLYYYNPQPDAKFGALMYSYSENLDTHKLTKFPNSEDKFYYYYIFNLSNGNRVCYNFLQYNRINGRLEDKNGKYICDVGQYYKGYFYSIETTEDLYPAIVKIDVNGNKTQVLRMDNKHSSICSLTINGDRLYFVSDNQNWNLYSCNLEGLDMVKY